MRCGDGHNDGLSRRDPEWPARSAISLCQSTNSCQLPFAGKVLCDDGSEAFDATHDGSMDHHWPRAIQFWIVDTRLICAVRQLELIGQLEIQLNGGSLELALERVGNCNVDFCRLFQHEFRWSSYICTHSGRRKHRRLLRVSTCQV